MRPRGSCTRLLSLLCATAAMTALTAHGAPLKLLLNDWVQVVGADASKVEAALKKSDPRVALRQALALGDKAALVVEACAHHELEVRLILRSDGWTDGAGVRLEGTLVLMQVGVPLGAVRVEFGPGALQSRGDEVFQKLALPLAAELWRSSLVTDLQKPPEGAAQGRSLACRRMAAQQAFVEPAPANPEDKAVAECAKKDPVACWEAGLIVRERGVKASDPAVSCTAANLHLASACSLGQGEACLSLGLNLQRCAKGDDNKKERDAAFLSALELGIALACPYVQGRTSAGVEDVRRACSELAAKGNRTDGPELQMLSCDLGHGPACAAVGELFQAGKAVRSSIEVARTFFAAACSSGSTADCARAKKPPPPPTPPTPPFKLPRKFGQMRAGLAVESLQPATIAAVVTPGAGWGGSFFFQGLIHERSNDGAGAGATGDFDLKAGFATNSGLILDSRAGIGLGLAFSRILLTPSIGVGLSGLGVMADSKGRMTADYALSGYLGGRLLMFMGPVLLEGRASAAVHWGRDGAEYRASGLLHIRHFMLGVEWTRYGNVGSQLSFLIGISGAGAR